jgi:cytochrome c-type biogenesis protein CcmF
MWQSLPEFGTGVLYAILVAAGYTFAVSLAAGRGHPRLLQSARLGAYATCSLVLFGVLLLAYAFITHDFRIRYVARYSDRSMPEGYLLTSLWGGQDGSLLWWSFLLSGYTAACVAWLKGRYRQLQPYVIATLMVVLSFFMVLMLFAANPFEASVAGARPDGEGLNPLLQNYWMAIHPPSLYMGFVGCTVPFAFCIAALVTGRLDNEWIVAVRKWMLFAFMFLSIGNALGMIWAYEELGWGGYWAWDPVENAACLPWFSAAAYVHSTMIQERKNMLKVWNVVLIAITFLLTIFGTFLTRSGIISSVHSFAQSEIGNYFLGFIVLILAAVGGLLVWRLPQLRARTEIESVASREAMFVINNWALLGAATFILIATMYPKLSDLWGESVTVGPPFFNRWMAPIGLIIFALMGLAPLFGWRTTSKESLKKAFTFPLAVLFATLVLHLAFGKALGYPPFVAKDAPYPGLVGVVLQKINMVLPAVTVALGGFNLAVIAQEFYRGVSARRRSTAKGDEPESVPVALLRLIAKNRRRYGGYIVHVGIVAMFLGFVGSAWTTDRETSLAPGQSYEIRDYTLTYEGPRMCPGNPKCSTAEQSDINKRMIFADLTVRRNGEDLGRASPAKFIYHRQPEMPTTEVAMLNSWSEDLYLVVGTVDPQSKRATFQFHVNPFVRFIWIGVMILILGAGISLFPELSLREAGVLAYARASFGVGTSLLFAIWLAVSPSTAFAHAGSSRSAAVHMEKQGPARPLERGWPLPIALGLATGVVAAALHRRPRRN